MSKNIMKVDDSSFKWQMVEVTFKSANYSVTSV
jgi:hypothetical protein